MKTGTHQRKINMQVLAQGDCPRCDGAVSSEGPHCPRCGLWQPWGDECVAQKRAERKREFVTRELREEGEWRELRAQENSHAPAFGLRFGCAHWWHITALRYHEKIWLFRAVTVAVVVIALVAIKRDTIRMQRENRQTPLQVLAAPTGICADGSDTYARSRSGACSGHQGVARFYSEAQ